MFRQLLVLSVVLGITTAAASAKPGVNAQARVALGRVLPEIKFTNVALKDCFDFLRDVSGANIHVNWKAIEATGVAPEMPVNVRLRAVALDKVLRVLLSETQADNKLTFYVDEGVIEVTTKEISDKQMITKVYPVEDLLVEIVDFESSVDFSLAGRNTGYNSGYGGGGAWGVGQGGVAGGAAAGGWGRLGGGAAAGGVAGDSQTRAKDTTPTKNKQERGDALVQLIVETVQPDIWRQNGGAAAIRFWQGSLIITAPRSAHEQIGGPVD